MIAVEWHPDLPSPEECRRAVGRLSRRQGQVLSRVAGGWATKEVARELRLAPSTVHCHLDAACRALGGIERHHLVAIFHRAGTAGPAVEEPCQPEPVVEPIQRVEWRPRSTLDLSAAELRRAAAAA